MARIKSCCFIFSTSTGTILIGVLCIAVSLFTLVPSCTLVDNNDFYVMQFVREQRNTGDRDIQDEEIDEIRTITKNIYSLWIAVDCAYILSSVGLFLGIYTRRRNFLLPWLAVQTFFITLSIIAVLALMYSFADSSSVLVLVCAAQPLCLSIYFNVIVLNVFNEMKIEAGQCRIRDLDIEVPSLVVARVEKPAVSESSSSSSFNSVKDGLQRIVDGTPPPPYETVIIDQTCESEKMLNEEESDKNSSPDVDVDVDEEPVIFADDECATLTGSDRDDESKASTVEQT